MCDVCYGIGNCPVCGHGSDEYDEYLEDLDNYLSDRADTLNDEERMSDEND